MQETPEQTAIFKAGLETNTSLMINAYAGTGKTTTITKLANLLDAQGKGGGVALAFNTKIKQELERRFPKTFTVMTLNGLGHRAWGRAIGKSLRLEERKLGLLVTEALKPYQLPKETWDDVRRLVTGAMQKGLVPSAYPHKGLLADTVANWSNIADDLWISANETTMQLARAVLINSIKQAFDGVISFDDQIYCSTMLGGVFPRFDLVLGDEAQDWSPLNHIQLAKTASDRIIAVGDPKQSLYAFRGADSNSMTNLRRLRKEWIDLPLATTFRCPKAIVARQQTHAPGFLAYHANPDGAVYNGSHYTVREGELEFGTRAKDSVEITWTWPDVQALGFEKVAILSRNNAQLISMAFKLLRQQIGVRMQGRDIGKGLIALSKKIIPKDDTPADECANAIEKWKNRECDLAYANSHEEKVAGITDRAESLMAVLESAMVETAGQLRKQLEYLFSKDTGQVLLSTIHRCVAPDTLIETANGLERIADINNTGLVATGNGEKEYHNKFKKQHGKVFKIKTDRGYNITVSPEHGLTVWNGNTHIKKQAQDIKTGDWLRLYIGSVLDTTVLPVMPENTKGYYNEKKYSVPKIMSVELAEFLGLFVGDGTLYKNGFRLVKRHKEVVDRFGKLSQILFGAEPKFDYHENTRMVEINSSFISRWLRTIDGITPNKKAIPAAILASPLFVQAAFLRGLFEDGTVLVDHGSKAAIDWSNKDPFLAETVQTMLLRFGIISTLKQYASTGLQSHIYIYSTSVHRFMEKIGFISSTKNIAAQNAATTTAKLNIPINHEEVEQMKSYLSKYERQNARWRGYIPRYMLESFRDLTKAPDWVDERLKWHYEPVTEIKEAESETYCITVPDGEKFIQNGFDGWNSKGMEWPLVIHLDPWRIPSKHARKAAAAGNTTALDQEYNAKYVAETRAQRVLVLANLQDFQ